jgi:hypothetical protein
VSKARASTVIFTVKASNASGQGSPASISVTWK